MPTYRCTTPRGLLDIERRAAVAAEITFMKRLRGASSTFSQVIFDEIAEGGYFVGAKALHGPQIHVHGTIRGGRSDQDLKKLSTSPLAGIASAARLPQRLVWIYLSELPARRMAEYGRMLPEPGDEAVWLKELAADRCPATDA